MLFTMCSCVVARVKSRLSENLIYKLISHSFVDENGHHSVYKNLTTFQLNSVNFHSNKLVAERIDFISNIFLKRANFV